MVLLTCALLSMAVLMLAAASWRLSGDTGSALTAGSDRAFARMSALQTGRRLQRTLPVTDLLAEQAAQSTAFSRVLRSGSDALPAFRQASGGHAEHPAVWQLAVLPLPTHATPDVASAAPPFFFRLTVTGWGVHDASAVTLQADWVPDHCVRQAEGACTWRGQWRDWRESSTPDA